MSFEGFRPKEKRPALAAEAAPEEEDALAAALAEIRGQFEEGDIEDRLEYHEGSHTEGVARRAGLIAEDLGLSGIDTELVKIAAAHHDIVQEWEENELPSGAVLRKRAVGNNENESADRAIAWMREHPGRFTPQHEAIVREAIEATKPGWDPVLKTVAQPNLTPESHPVALAVALADLGTSGMEPEVFRGEGTDLFAEEQLDIMRAIRNAEKATDIPEAVQQQYLERYRTWMKFQTTFVEGRRERFKQEIAGRSPEAIERLTARFSQFDESLKIAEENAAAAEKLSFEGLAQSLVVSAFVNNPSAELPQESAST